MAFRLHHVFIFTDPGAPEADRLASTGLVEGLPNTHPGQGTANRRFFFEDAGLELLFLCNEAEARSGAGRELRSADRWLTPDASPFGLILGVDDDADLAGFPGWQYQPDYFDKGMYFLVGENSRLLSEPFCAVMPCNLPKVPLTERSPAPFDRVTEVRVSVPVQNFSPALTVAGNVKRIALRAGKPHLMEIVFNDEATGQSCDLRPGLPLIVRW
jgi:hypothetical protein